MFHLNLSWWSPRTDGSLVDISGTNGRGCFNVDWRWREITFRFQKTYQHDLNFEQSIRNWASIWNQPDSSVALTFTLWTFGSTFDRSLPDIVAWPWTVIVKTRTRSYDSLTWVVSRIGLRLVYLVLMLLIKVAEWIYSNIFEIVSMSHCLIVLL